MNLVGKILTLLIFVMSIAFMSMSVILFQSHNNWRDEVVRQEAQGLKPKGYQYRLADAENEKRTLLAQLEKMKNDLTAEKSARETAVANLETLFKGREAAWEESSQENLKLRDIEAKNVATLEADHKTLADMQKERDEHRKRIGEAEKARDESFGNSTLLADQVHQLETERKRLEARMEDLVKDIERARDLLQSNDIEPNGNPAHILPNVKGVVLAMPGKDLMEISIGADDGLLPGHHLEVYRIGSGANVYLGKVEVMRTVPDKAVCKILPDYRQGPVRTGDRVASKLE